MRRPSHTAIALLAALALLATSGWLAHAPVASAAATPFTDIAGTTFEHDIEWLFAEGITKGCTATTYCPERAVSRGEMASFLVRMFKLPPTGTDYFTDDEGTTHEIEINKLAASGITVGCTATTFCPQANVRRDEMASFLARAIPLTVGAGDGYFRDDDGTTHEANIDRAAAAGITTGCAPWRYCIAANVTRGQMAGYLHRVVAPVTPPPHPAPTGPQTLFVATTGTDAGNSCLDKADPCRTIRWALFVSVSGDTIAIRPGTFLEENLSVDHDLTIEGDPTGATVIDASGGSRQRIFDIGPVAVSLTQLELQGGDAGLGYMDNGGAIRSAGDLHISHSRIRSNRARIGAGVFATDGSLTIDDTVISGNVAAWEGGGIAAGLLGGVRVTASRIEGNTARAYGGGIYGAGLVRIDRSTISGNSVTLFQPETWHGGGGAALDGDTIISNSTIADNISADVGGGIQFSYGDLTIVNTTISGNSADTTGGAMLVYQYQDPSTSTMSLRNTVVIGNSSPSRPEIGCFGPDRTDIACAYATNIASIISVPAGVTLADILDPHGLKDNGGPTETIALTGSAKNPALDAGDAGTCAAAPVDGVDQRGLPRTPPCDIGAYELQP